MPLARGDAIKANVCLTFVPKRPRAPRGEGELEADDKSMMGIRWTLKLGPLYPVDRTIRYNIVK